MPISLSKNELAQILGAEIISNSEKIVFSGIQHDSRLIKGGELFIALKGEKTHGHEYVKDVLDRGAALALVESKAIKDVDLERIIVVKDTLEAYGKLASWWRDKTNIKLIGVTGSVGKTTVKEMLSRILMETGVGTYSQKSYNNHVGVPYTLSQISLDHKWAVIEMGMNHTGEIEYLTKIAKPDVAVISKLAPAHIENLGSLEKIAEAKLEIIKGLKQNGTLILNGSDSVLLEEERKIHNNNYKLVTFGNENSSVSASNIKSLALDGISFKLHLGANTYDLKMKIIGVHNAMNAVAAAISAKALFRDIKDETIVKGLEKFTAPLMRLEIYELPNGIKIVDDSYNANPESMAALVALAKEVKSGGNRVGLVVGDMLELGSHSILAHKELGERILALEPEFCISVGKNSVEIDKVLKDKVKSSHVNNAKDAVDLVKDYSYDVLMVKASRGIGLDEVVKSLVSESVRST